MSGGHVCEDAQARTPVLPMLKHTVSDLSVKVFAHACQTPLEKAGQTYKLANPEMPAFLRFLLSRI